ncbi:uncharacterized protein LOC129217455 [Uloborus diversus]|uniref:uncharacterized protein LOC129217455 n=1 Tax=Uloborus diversus TaxID=327109 RepID=UPI002409846E|nr:uncharacterized protein LOC129217455 [Uloborus diversus]
MPQRYVSSPIIPAHGNRGMSHNLKTPVLNNNQWSFQQNDGSSFEEDYNAAYESMDHDGWGPSAYQSSRTLPNVTPGPESAFFMPRKEQGLQEMYTYGDRHVDNDEMNYANNNEKFYFKKGEDFYNRQSNSKRKNEYLPQRNETFNAKKAQTNAINKPVPNQIPLLKTPVLKYQQANAESARNKKIQNSMRQTTLTTDTSKGLGFKLEKANKENNMNDIDGDAMETPKPFPKWGSASSYSKLESNKEFNFPRVFTVTVEKLLSWPKILAGSKAVFELYGILERISDGKISKSKNISLKSEKARVLLNCTFYEIDRPIPKLNKGQWHR